MKRALLLIVAAMVLAGTVGGGVVSAQGEVAIVNIPFQFTAHQKVMPAGRYEINVADPTVISLIPVKGNAVIVPVITRLAQRGAPMTAAEVVFDKVGEQYTLSEVWLPTDDGYLLHDLKTPHQHHVVKGTKKG